jgi:hypothetical protein
VVQVPEQDWGADNCAVKHEVKAGFLHGIFTRGLDLWHGDFPMRFDPEEVLFSQIVLSRLAGMQDCDPHAFSTRSHFLGARNQALGLVVK